MHDATLEIRKPHHFIRVNQEMKQDMGLWLTLWHEFSGRVYFSEAVWSSNLVLELFTDIAGAGNFGCGAYFQGDWCYFHWPSHWDSLNSVSYTHLTLPTICSV